MDPFAAALAMLFLASLVGLVVFYILKWAGEAKRAVARFFGEAAATKMSAPTVVSTHGLVPEAATIRTSIKTSIEPTPANRSPAGTEPPTPTPLLATDSLGASPPSFRPRNIRSPPSALAQQVAARLMPKPVSATSAAPEKERSSTATSYVDPRHFNRHAGMPGHLYLARNDMHRRGVYKLGYTLGHPSERAKTLNAETSQMRGLGTFGIVDSAPVRAAFDAEQLLFEALTQRRISTTREFFFDDEQVLRVALREVAGVDMQDQRERALCIDRWALTRVQHVRLTPSIDHIPPALPGGGWIYIFEPHWYVQPLYYACCTRMPARTILALLKRRSAATSLPDGFSLVHAEPVVNVAAARQAWVRAVRPFRFASKHPAWLKADLGDLRPVATVAALAECVPSERLGSSNSSEWPAKKDINVTRVARALPQWSAWCMGCKCGALLRFTGKIGAVETLSCPACGNELACKMRSFGIEVGTP